MPWNFLPRDAFVRRLVYGIGIVGAAHFASEYNQDVRHVFSGIKRNGRIASAAILAAADYKFTRAKQGFLHADMTQKELDQEKVHLRSARRLLHAMEQNGGIYIKLGQHLASLTYLLPVEWTQTFSILFRKCPQSSLEDINRMFLADLGIPLDSMFTKFDPVPLGIASLAQVHRATLASTGEEVAVMLQHPALREFSQTDM